MSRFLSLALAALTLAGPALAQDGARRTPPDVSAGITALAGRLEVSADQRARLAALATRYRGQTDAAAFWAASADVQGVLTEAQTTALLSRPHRTRRAEAGRERPTAARAARRPGRRGAARATREGRTGGGRQAMEAVRSEFAPRAQALREDLRAGRITDAEFASRSQALRAEVEARIDATRTPEQRQQAAESRARREAGEAARVRVLELTAQQQDALRALQAERVRTAPQRSEADRAAHDALRARAAEILTPQQEAVMAVHRALTGGGRGHRGGPHGAEGRGRGAIPTTDR